MLGHIARNSSYSFIFLCISLLMALSSCHSSKELINEYEYFQKHRDTLDSIKNVLKEPIIQKNDQLSIAVHSATINQDQVQVFNVLNSQGIGGVVNQNIIGYLVDFEGNINMPVIGKIKAAGLTKIALGHDIEMKLAPYVKDPLVNIRFLNFKVTLLGEVGTQGPQLFYNDRATIVDAIGQAGGLTDLGKRSNILVIRELPDGKRHTDTLNINDASIFSSNAYQLQQNDIVYVSPQKIKLKNLNTNPTIYRDIPFIISLFSTLLLLVNLILK